MQRKILHIEISEELLEQMKALVISDKIEYPTLSHIVRKALKEYINALSKQA